MVITLGIGQSAVSLSTSAMVGYDRHSETERVLVCNDRLATLNMLKIQSGPFGNIGGAAFIEYLKKHIKILTINAATV